MGRSVHERDPALLVQDIQAFGHAVHDDGTKPFGLLCLSYPPGTMPIPRISPSTRTGKCFESRGRPLTVAWPAGRLRTVAGAALDGLVERMLALSPFEYRVARDASEREAAYRLRARTVIDRGWCRAVDLPSGQESDEYDDAAIQVIGWDGVLPMCTGRIVLPPRLPTEEICGIVVEPRGEVVDVGRMCVATSHQSRQHAAFIGLMCGLYAQMRAQGFQLACGMMTPPACALVRQLGLELEILGPKRLYWNEARSPVRFGLMTSSAVLSREPIG